MTMRWHFPSTDGGDVDGFNNPLLETFGGNSERYIARECIQNSLDARDDDSKPVRVEFKRFDLPINSIPGIKNLRNTLEYAKDFSKNQDNSDKFYNNAIQKLDGHANISVLKISDYNTTGLTGDDNDTGGGWYRLVRATGASSMTGDGGGSFGIGKGAPFASSILRTVYYSTKTENGVAFQGKTIISSFKNSEGDIRRGVGQYGEENGAGQGVKAIRDIPNIPKAFQRQEQGTDIYIIGYMESNDEWKQKMLQSVLDSFWMAIYKGTLLVDIVDSKDSLQITSNNIGELINKYASEEEYTKLFYRAVAEATSSDAFREATLPQLGKVELYVRVGEGPKHIQGMRRSLMKIHTFDRLRVMPDNFVGVFVARDNEGNKHLRNLEPPAHDKWDKDRGKNSPESQEALDTARSWIINILREMSNKKTGCPEEIPDLNKYLPEDTIRYSLDDAYSNNGEIDQSGSGERETADVVGIMADEESSMSHPPVTCRATIIKPAASSDKGPRRPKVGQRSGKGFGGKSGGALDEKGDKKFINVADLEFRAVESCQNGRRSYAINIRPSKDDSGILQIVAQADANDLYPLDIISVIDENGKEYVVENGQIKDLELKRGVPKQLKVELQSNRRYALGVK